MSKWDKLLARICSLSKDMRFSELQKVLESYGYEMQAPKGGSSHFASREQCPLQFQSMNQLKKFMCKRSKS